MSLPGPPEQELGFHLPPRGYPVLLDAVQPGPSPSPGGKELLLLESVPRALSQRAAGGVGRQAFNCLSHVATEKERVQLQPAAAAVPCWSLLFSLEGKWGTAVAWGLEAKLVFKLLACQQTLFRPCYNNPFAKEDLAFRRENGLSLVTQAVHSRAKDTGLWTLRATAVFFGASASCCQDVST